MQCPSSLPKVFWWVALNGSHEKKVQIKDNIQSVERVNDYSVRFIDRQAKEEVPDSEPKKGAA
jgi:hypothetical protein